MFKNQRGFTLIEMLIVLMIISVLIILIIPNLGEKSDDVHDKGCEALVSLVQAQADAFHIDENRDPSMQDLLDGNYITKDQKTCSNGANLAIENGTVSSNGTQ